MATAVSKTASNTKADKIVATKRISDEVAGLLKRTIRRCPATIFAASRTDRVTGRITALTISISTINGLRAIGLPKGTKWASMLLVDLIHAITTCPTQRGRAMANVRLMWLEAVKI